MDILSDIHTQNPEEVRDLLCPFIPIRTMFGKTSMFIADDYEDTDTLKIDIFSMSAVRLNRLAKLLRNKSIYLTYFPHIVLGKLKPFHAMRYAGNNTVIGKKMIVNSLFFETDTTTYTISPSGEIVEV